MYAITNDYFDSFSAIFCPRECLLNGKRYPLGYFAVEVLEMDRRLLRDLKKAVADFKLEFEYHDFMSDYRSPWVFNKVLQKP